MLGVYTINRQTKAIMCQQDLAYRTLIYEGDCQINSIHCLEKILDANCTSHGASLEGRLAFAKHVLRTSIKLPITVHPRKGIFMVPTHSLRSEKCGVIAYYQISQYQALNNGKKTHIRFRDATDLILDTSFRSFNMQYKKTGQLIASLLQPLGD